MDTNPQYLPSQPRQYEYSPHFHPLHHLDARLELQDGETVVKLSNNRIPFCRETTRYGDPDFIRALVKAVDINRVPTQSKWQYGNRQTAQEILPFLLLGPMSFARHAEQVSKAGITMMIAVRAKSIVEKIPSFMDPTKYPSAVGRETITFDMDTSLDLSLGRFSIIQAINNHLKKLSADNPIHGISDIPGKVLIFCETGNERAPAVVAMYLMVLWGLSPDSACQLVHARRNGMALRPDMIRGLKALDDYLEAERLIVSETTDAYHKLKGLQLKEPTYGQTTLKRSSAQRDDSDDHMDVDDGVDVDPNNNHSLRPSVAPFSDQPN